MAKRIKNKARSLYYEGNFKDYIIFCEKSNLPYKLIESNYTTTIESDFCNITFMRQQMDNKAFIAGAKIRKDIIETGLTPPDINQDDLVYFNFSMPERLKTGKHTIYNIDIKSAYANVLKNHSLILPKTYGYMCSLSKQNRLACVGMLASKKEIYHMIGNEIQTLEIVRKDTENWFYFCVKRTNEIMNACRSLITKDFLFYWVDGIFFDNEKNAIKVGEKLKEYGYKYSFDVCENFLYTEDDTGKRIEYDKDGVRKKLFLPKKNSMVDEFLIKFLSFHNKTKKNEH